MSRARLVRVGRRGLAVLVIGLAYVVANFDSWAEGGRAEGTTSVEIYAGTDWYRARPEPEEERRGVLRTRDNPAGPASRPALRYALDSGGEVIAVYAPQPSRQLASLAGQVVVVYGKVVDLSNEGFGKELWIGSVRRATP